MSVLISFFHLPKSKSIMVNFDCSVFRQNLAWIQKRPLRNHKKKKLFWFVTHIPKYASTDTLYRIYVCPYMNIVCAAFWRRGLNIFLVAYLLLASNRVLVLFFYEIQRSPNHLTSSVYIFTNEIIAEMKSVTRHRERLKVEM